MSDEPAGSPRRRLPRGLGVGGQLRSGTVGTTPLRVGLSARSTVLSPDPVEVTRTVGVGLPRREGPRREGKPVIRACLFWRTQRTGFELVGDQVETSEWLDPIRFLQDRGADAHPAPVQSSSLSGQSPVTLRAAPGTSQGGAGYLSGRRRVPLRAAMVTLRPREPAPSAGVDWGCRGRPRSA